jgi:pimeloyl-ACP methyl ester carboxylesterase
VSDPADRPTPEWFRAAIAHHHEELTVRVSGADIRYLSWGERGRPGLVFVHGGAAHAHWWSFIAPHFRRDWHAVAIHLSGHGDSGRRPTYSHEQWAQEVMAVADDAGFPGPPVVVGHSLGGMVTIQTAATYGEDLSGAVIVDAPVRRPSPEAEEGRSGRAFRSPGVYGSVEEAMRHFRLVPPQPCDNDYIVEWIARTSLRETDTGWTWKFDPAVFHGTIVPLRDQLASVRCRVALLTGELSVVVPPDTARYMYDLMGRVAPVIAIPEAHHHLTLDQPLAFVAALRTLLADWNHSVGFDRAQSADVQ